MVICCETWVFGYWLLDFLDMSACNYACMHARVYLLWFLGLLEFLGNDLYPGVDRASDD